MIVLGIDPGYALMGWGVVESEGSRMKLINYGCVETKAGVPTSMLPLRWVMRMNWVCFP